MTTRLCARSVRLSTKRLTRRSPTKISRKQSVARSSADALTPSSSHSAKNLTPFILFYWPALVMANGIGTRTLIRQESVPHLSAIVTIPDFSRKSIAPVSAVEIPLQDRIAHPTCCLLTILFGNQRADRGDIPRTPSWARQTKPGPLVLVLFAPNILASLSKRGQVVRDLNDLATAWTPYHITPNSRR